jgi:hypothetical protein
MQQAGQFTLERERTRPSRGLDTTVETCAGGFGLSLTKQ